MGIAGFEGNDWQNDLRVWLEPFLAALGRSEQRQWAPLYVQGLLADGARKSVEPMAERVCPGQTQQLHHFVATSPWACEPLQRVLRHRADALVGGDGAVLIVDDTALLKQGRHSVGVKHQYCGLLGKQANCQVLVSLTLAREEVPVPIDLRLYLPEDWASDEARRAAAKVPESIGFMTKGDIALAQIDQALADGVRFGLVLADAGFGSSAAFRAGLSARGLLWAVGVLPTNKVYPADVTLLEAPRPALGRPPKHPRPSAPSVAAEDMIAALGPRALRRCSWRCGTKGVLAARFACVRVRVADGAPIRGGRHLPGQAVWLVCELRSTGERKYYFTNHPASTPRLRLVRAIKARWACEQAHQQLKDELGLDHFEGRSWLGLHHHALLSMMAFAYLQHHRLLQASQSGEKNQRRAPPARPLSRRCPRCGAQSSRRSTPSFASTAPAAAPW